MKKFIALFLVMLTLLSLIACSSSPEGQIDNLNTPNNILSEDSSSTSEDNKTKVDMSKVTDSSGFSEGKAWVRFGKITSKEYSTIHCINKNGKILFSVKQTVLNNPSDFYNGIAIIPMSIEGDFICDICDENGNITKPADVGADEFLINPNFENDIEFKLFQDGYILAKKTETTFNSSSEKLAIFNSKLEPLADYSAELYQLYEQFSGTYYDGYLISMKEEKILNLRTGKIVDNPTEVLASFNPEYASDLWDSEGKCYYDIFSGTKALDLSQYSETIHRLYDF